MLVSIDIETAPGFGFETYEDAAIDHHRNRITQIAWACSDGTNGVHNSIAVLNSQIEEWRTKDPRFGGHNFKFDLKTLITKGAHLSSADYHEDSMLQAVANCQKIPDSWLAEYEAKRKALNKELGRDVHRNSGVHGLKTLAPYILNVEPFWEAASHDDAAYALKDATYTLDLIVKQSEILRASSQYEFYRRLVRWSAMFLDAELTGLAVDLDLVEKKRAESALALVKAEENLKKLWVEPVAAYQKMQEDKLAAKYQSMAAIAIAKPTKKPKDEDKVREKYANLYANALSSIEPFNMASPSQLMWLLRDHYGLDVNTVEGDESTGKPVLNKLAESGRSDIQALLDFRRHTKLQSSFFPIYPTMNWNGRIHPSFHLMTRTGRSGCSGPNIQQTPADLHDLYVAGEGRKLICYDLANIEPMLIAYLTECPVLCDLMINNKSFHDDNAITMFGLNCSHSEVKTLYPKHRKVAKDAGLALLYGAGPMRLEHIGIAKDLPFTQSQAREIYAGFKKKYQVVYDYKKELDRRLERGEPVTNLLGRQYTISNRDDVYMKGFNTLIQGSASDLLIESACRANESGKHLGLRFLASVHDECIFDVPTQHAEAGNKLVESSMLNYFLPTSYGPISLKCEGGVFDYWKH